MQVSKEKLVESLFADLQPKPAIDDERSIITTIIESAHARKDSEFLYVKISGELLASLLMMDSNLAQYISCFGIRIKGLTISSKFNLDSAKIDFPLVFKECIFEDDIILRDARTKYLSFEGCECQYIEASRIAVDGSLWLNRGFSARQGIDLNGARITGNLTLASAKINPIQNKKSNSGKSLVLDDTAINGSLLLWSKDQENEFESRGEISLVGARIGGSFIFRKAKLQSDSQYIINKKENKPLALVANFSTINGEIDFCDVEAVGQILLMNMEIHGDVNCENGKFMCSQKLKNEHPEDHHKHAISFDRSIIHGSIFLCDGFEAKGQVRLIGTTIQNDLDCSAGSFWLSDDATEEYTVLIARGNIQGNVSFRKALPGRANELPFKTNGILYLENARIGCNLSMGWDVQFEKNDRWNNGLATFGCTIGGYVSCQGIQVNDKTVIILSETISAGLTHNWNDFLPKSGGQTKKINRLDLDGFVYDRYSNESVNKSTKWLELLKKDHSLSVNQQLAMVLIKDGKEREATDVLIDMEAKKLSRRCKFCNYISWVLKHITAFGYRPLKPLRNVHEIT